MTALLLEGGRIVSVWTGETFDADVLVRGERIDAVLPPGSVAGNAALERLDARGLLVVPGFIDAHMHVESAFLTPAPFAWLTLARGTTTVLADCHEIVNVAGLPALRWMVEQGRRTAQTMRWGIPSCVPALPGFETAGAEVGLEAFEAVEDLPEVVALGEVMDYRAVIRGDARMQSMTAEARRRDMILDGHCPGIGGADLSAYLTTGIDSDHTKNAPGNALEKARAGMELLLQEKSLLPELVGRLLRLPLQPPFCLVTDDVAADAIVGRGHLDEVARRAIDAGMPPLVALRAITLEPARRLRLHDRGTVTPGKRADLVLVDDLATLRPHLVMTGGRVVGRDGEPVGPEPTAEPAFTDSVRLAPLVADDLQWRLASSAVEVTLTAIRVNPLDTSTERTTVEARLGDGEVVLAPGAALLGVIHRHGRTGDRAFAPVVGQALAEGAVATTYAHDSHNLLVLGTSRPAMLAAANAVISSGGGIAVARGGRIVAHLPLPVGGVMSTSPALDVAAGAAAVRAALEEWGYRHPNPFMSVSTLALPVSPALKLTDRGLVDVAARAWAEASV